MGDSDDSYDFTQTRSVRRKTSSRLRPGDGESLCRREFARVPCPGRTATLATRSSRGSVGSSFDCPAKDFHCGLRGYSREGYAKFDMRTTGMEYASEMVIKSTLLDLKMIEVPTTLDPDGRSRPPHLRPWRDGWRHLVFMLLYSPKWLFLYPGAMLLGLGLLLLAMLWSGPVHLTGLRFDVHTMLYAALMVIIGFQTVVFAVFTKVFAIQEGLLHPDRRLDRLLQVFTLEVGCLSGTALVIAGLVGSIKAVTQWGQHSFGLLDPTLMLRLVIPSGMALTLGVQLIFSSFFLRILNLRVRRLK